MTHLKRHEAPKNWPIKRKGTKFVVRPNFAQNDGVPLLILLRDMLELCRNKKEVKSIIHDKKILVNMKEAKDEKNSLVLFDTISIIPLKKQYKLILSDKGKFGLEEVGEKEASHKIAKIVNKKTLKGKKIQINLSDGKNYISNMKCEINDSVVIDLKNRKIEKCVPLKEKSKVIVFGGKHAGSQGVLEKLDQEKKIAKLKIAGKEVNVLLKQIMGVE